MFFEAEKTVSKCSSLVRHQQKIDRDGKYKVRSKSAQYISCKAAEKFLKVTRGVLKDRRNLFSHAIFVIGKYYNLFLRFVKAAL